MIGFMIFLSFFFILSANQKTSIDTLAIPKLDLRDGTFTFDSPIDLTNFLIENLHQLCFQVNQI